MVLRTLCLVRICALTVAVIDRMFLHFGKNMTFQIVFRHIGWPNGNLLTVVGGGGGYSNLGCLMWIKHLFCYTSRFNTNFLKFDYLLKLRMQFRVTNVSVLHVVLLVVSLLTERSKWDPHMLVRISINSALSSVYQFKRKIQLKSTWRRTNF